jgi:hypothetical protein
MSEIKGKPVRKVKIGYIGGVLTIILAMVVSAHADGTPPPAPDTCTTSVLLACVAGGLGLVRKFMR